MGNARLDESQAGIKIARRNINSLTYAYDSLMAEVEKTLKSLLIRVKEENEKAGLKFNIQKIKIMASGPITSWQIDGEKIETGTDLVFLDCEELLSMLTAAMKFERCLLLGRRAMTNLVKVKVLVAQSCPTVRYHGL